VAFQLSFLSTKKALINNVFIILKRMKKLTKLIIQSFKRMSKKTESANRFLKNDQI